MNAKNALAYQASATKTEERNIRRTPDFGDSVQISGGKFSDDFQNGFLAPAPETEVPGSDGDVPIFENAETVGKFIFVDLFSTMLSTFSANLKTTKLKWFYVGNVFLLKMSIILSILDHAKICMSKKPLYHYANALQSQKVL
jgi:hypothetical protein